MKLTPAHVLAARADLARNHMIDFAPQIVPGYQVAAHHRLICDHLEAVERREIDRLMITMPPRHGKSQLASRLFPAWLMGRNPRQQIIAASYNSDIAMDFGRDVRNIIGSQEFSTIFPDVALSPDSKAANRMNTNHGGAYIAAGVGTAITGRGAHVALIDDPFKDRAEADSERTRDNVWAWYQSTLYTRLMPKAAICVINCMTGDTPVLMADGEHMLLADMQPGVMVMSYDGLQMVPKKVTNWANQGCDNIFAITMKSGRVVRANERHPFLVRKPEGDQWIKVLSLSINDKVLSLQGIGGSGKASSALRKDVKRPPVVRECAPRITRSRNGLAAIAPHLSTTMPIGLPTFAIDTASTLSITTECLLGKEESALSARAIVCGAAKRPSGEDIFASIIATALAGLGDFSATIATWLSDMGKPQSVSTPPLNTYEIETDQIVSIEFAGREDVFDIEVEGTHNFVANGLLTHNTRWHDDDLSGRLLNGKDEWTMLDLPAINAEGEALWPEWYPIEALERIRDNIGPREFSALFQQRPQPDEGTYFQRHWFRSWSEPRPAMNIYASSDYAVTDGGGDYTVLTVWGVDKDGNIYRIDQWKGQTTPDVWIDAQVDMIGKWKPLCWFGEAGVIQKSIEPMLRRRMIETKKMCRLEWVPSIADKPTRARPFQARLAMGKVLFEPDAEITEFLRFPAGVHDDEVDTASLIGRVVDEMHPAIIRSVPIDHNPADLSQWGRKRARVGGASAWG